MFYRASSPPPRQKLCSSTIAKEHHVHALDNNRCVASATFQGTRHHWTQPGITGGPAHRKKHNCEKRSCPTMHSTTCIRCSISNLHATIQLWQRIDPDLANTSIQIDMLTTLASKLKLLDMTRGFYPSSSGTHGNIRAMRRFPEN